MTHVRCQLSSSYSGPARLQSCVKNKYTMKVTSQLTNGNKIKRKIRNIKYKGKGQVREGTNRANAFSYGLRTIS